MPSPQLVEHVPHTPQLDHEPSTKNSIERQKWTDQSFFQPWQLSVSVELPEHGVPALCVRKRDLVPIPQLVEHAPHTPQTDHEPSSKNIIERQKFTYQSFSNLGSPRCLMTEANSCPNLGSFLSALVRL